MDTNETDFFPKLMMIVMVGLILMTKRVRIHFFTEIFMENFGEIKVRCKKTRLGWCTFIFSLGGRNLLSPMSRNEVPVSYHHLRFVVHRQKTNTLYK